MFFVDFLFALFFGLILAIMFTGGFRTTGSWASFWGFLVVLVLATWAGGVWLYPLGRPLWGTYWLSFLLAGILFTLLLAAVAGPQQKHVRLKRGSGEQELGERKMFLRGMNISFWVLSLLLVVTIVSFYLQEV